MSICDSLKKNTHMYLHTQSWFHCRVAPAVYQSAFSVPRVHRWMKPSYWWLFLGDSYEWKLVIFSQPSFISNGSFSFFFFFSLSRTLPLPPFFLFFFFFSAFSDSSSAIRLKTLWFYYCCFGGFISLIARFNYSKKATRIIEFIYIWDEIPT